VTKLPRTADPAAGGGFRDGPRRDFLRLRKGRDFRGETRGNDSCRCSATPESSNTADWIVVVTPATQKRTTSGWPGRAERLRVRGRATRVCSHHLLGAHVQGIPPKWDGARFDVVLGFDRAGPDRAVVAQAMVSEALGRRSDNLLGPLESLRCPPDRETALLPPPSGRSSGGESIAQGLILPDRRRALRQPSARRKSAMAGC
jgi:hypothetical protein